MCIHCFVMLCIDVYIVILLDILISKGECERLCLFLSWHRSAETLCWLWYVVVVGLISIFMNPMRMHLNYKMASTSFNKIKLAAGV